MAPKVSSHFLEKAGLSGSFKLEGSLVGGLTVRDLNLDGRSTISSLHASRIRVDYSPSHLFHRTVRRIEVDSLHVDLDLDAPASVSENEEPGKPFSFRDLGDTLRNVRSMLLPVGIDLSGLSLNIKKGGGHLLSLAPSAIRHDPGAAELHVDLGSLIDSNGREWQSQQSTITWNSEDLLLDRIDPLPGLGIRDLVLRMPVTGGPSADMEIFLEDAVLLVEAGEDFKSVRIDLREGRVNARKIAGRFGVEIPVAGEISSLSVIAENLMPDPLAADVEGRFLLERVQWKDWKVPELSLDVGLFANRVTLAANGRALDTGVSINAEAVLGSGAERFSPSSLDGHFKVADVTRLLVALSQHVEAIDPLAPVPASTLDGRFSLMFDDMKPSAGDLLIALNPLDPLHGSPVRIKGLMKESNSLEATVVLDGAEIHVVYQTDARSYIADARFEEFKTARIDPWLTAFKAGTDGAATLTGVWRGSGEINETHHAGCFSLASLEFQRVDMPPLTAGAGIDYDWPSRLSLENLKLVSKDQTITANAELADGVVDVSDLTWIDRETTMAGGSLKLPVPEDFSKWREALASDTRPLSVDIESKVLSLGLLKDWLPAASQLDSESTGMLRLKVSGDYSKPEIDLLVDLKNLRSPEQPKLPPADLSVTASGRDSLFKVDARASAPDYPPAVLTASMPFRPAEWAEHPESINSEKFTARLDLPRLDLSRFASLVSAAEKLNGVLTGNMEVAGELSKPVIKGKLSLSGGGLVLKDAKIPPVSAAEAVVDFDLNQVTLRSLKATMSEGTFQAGGSLKLDSGKPGLLDFRVTANQLPLVRDDSVIVRANANLRLAGPFERAALTGTVGVVNSLFFRDIELLPIGSPFTGPSAAALPRVDAARGNPGASIPEPFHNWTIDVRVRTENSFLVRGNLATGEATADILASGTFGSPTLDGEVKIKDFQAALPFTTLKIPRGTVRFTPATGFDPVLEIRGTAEPRPYRINVFAYGSVSKPKLLLTSSPPLPENEIMTLLATGTTTAGLENTQAASSRAMQLVIEEFRRGRFAGSKTLRPVFKLLDRVDFSLAEEDPYSGDSFSSATIHLSDRWYVSAGMGAEGDTRLMGVWRISFR